VNQSFVSPELRQRVRGWAVPVARALGRVGLTPNHLTVIGFIGTCGAALNASLQQWALAGVLVLVFGIFDLFDGALARATGQTSRFGAFLDSTLDRTGENLVYAGIAIGAAAAGFMPGVAVAVLALAFASVVTYARAKAEVVGLHGEVGFAPREVRLAILGIGLILLGIQGGTTQWMFPNELGDWILLGSLGVIAALSAVTVIQRILHTRTQLDNQEPR
jgi:CDP-diacylglycerol---glycerol-3-phosphate 3-phosphatidyltransferase